MEPRVRLLTAQIFLVFLFAAYALVAATDSNRSSMVWRGDFPAFYAAAKIATSADHVQLYNPQLQQQTQNALWPSLNQKYLYFAYPPFVAALFTPLTEFSPGFAKQLYTTLSFLAVWLAISLMTNSKLFTREILPPLALLLAFFPLTIAIFGGQNTAFSVLLFAAAYSCFLKNSFRGDLFAGIALGLWLFKPQFALLALALPLLARRWAQLIGAIIPAALYAALTYIVTGPASFYKWLQAVTFFSSEHLQANHSEFVGLLGATHAATHNTLPWLADSVGIAATLIVLALTAKRFRYNADAFPHAFMLLAAAMILIAPHTSFYDLGIPAICLVTLCTTERISLRPIWLVAAISVILILCAIRTNLAFPVFAPIAIAAFYWLVARHPAATVKIN